MKSARELALNLLLMSCAVRGILGIFCYQCEDAASSDSCNQPRACNIESGCFVQTWLNDEGTRYYSKGCFNPRAKKCEHFSDNCTPQQPLLECCNSSLCNTRDPLADWKPLAPKSIEVIQQPDASSIRLTWSRQCDDLYVYVVSYSRDGEKFTSNLTTDNSILVGPLEEGNYTFAIRSHHSKVFSEITAIRTTIQSPPTVVEPSSSSVSLSRTSLIIIIVVAILVVLLISILICCYVVKSRKKQARYDVDRIYSIPTSPGATQSTTNMP